ncbi:MAG: lysyl oxidase family protein, partial [Thermoleophilaceae bacterium]
MALRFGLALLVALLLGAGGAQAAGLPDLKQEVPTKVSVSGGSGGGQIVFQSEVTNVGSGPLEVHGHRSSTSGNMTADQIVGSTTIGGIGDLHYETGFGHQHWHFEPFDHYELRTLGGVLVGSDVKQGFCLGDNNNHGGGSRVFTDFCKQNQPDALEVTEGISPGWGDSYDPGKEGQDIPISSSTESPGNYDLVHRVNENRDGSHGPVHESAFGNNVASAEVQIGWSSGTPSIKVLKTCSGTATCVTSTPPVTTTTTTTTS